MDSVIKGTFNFQQNTAAEICSEKAAFLLNRLVRPCGVGKVSGWPTGGKKAAAKRRHRAENLIQELQGFGREMHLRQGLPALPFTPGPARRVCVREGPRGGIQRGLSFVFAASSVSQPPMGEHSPSLRGDPWCCPELSVLEGEGTSEPPWPRSLCLPGPRSPSYQRSTLIET